MMIEESETPDVGSHSDVSDDVLAERRARRAEAGDPTVIRRADAAEAAVRNLETHLAALERRLEEVGRERERIAQQLIERESDVRNVKQREFVEQQLRVEAEQRSERLQRDMRTEIQELGSRLEETERHVRELDAELAQLRERDARLVPIVRELMDVAAGLRTGFERELTALREELQQQVVWERETYVRELTAMGARMEDLRFELTRTADDLRAQLAAEPPSAELLQHTTEPDSEREAAHRREMADALVAAVERLRARVAEVKDAEEIESEQSHVEQPDIEQPRVEWRADEPAAAVVEEPPAPESPVDTAVESVYTAQSEESSTEFDQPAQETKADSAISGYVPAAQTHVFEPPIVDSTVPAPPVVEPEVAEPEAFEASVVEPAVAEPEAFEASVVEPEVAEPEAFEASVVEPEVVEPEAFEPSVAESAVAEPEAFDSSVVESETLDPPVVEPSAADVKVEPVYTGYVPASGRSPVIEPRVTESPAVEDAETDDLLAGELSVGELPMDESRVDEQSVGEPAIDEPAVDEPAVDESPAVEPAVENMSVGAVPREEPPAPESPLSDLGPSGAVSAKVVTSKPVVLQPRLLSVPEKRTSWLAPAIRRLATQRDAKLAAELVIELIPAQRQVVEESLSYEIKINELGTFYVALDSAQAIISREPRGTVDFSLEGSVAAFGELAAGGMSRRRPGLRIRKGRRRARGLLKARRRPIALADLAASQIDVWPGLLLLVMAEAIDPSWTTGRRFELAFDIQGTSGIVIYVRVCDGEPILVSRTPVGQPVATISLSGHALICLLAGTQAPADHKTMVRGDTTSVEMFLEWTARAQGLSVAVA
jgi:hypothetical protein